MFVWDQGILVGFPHVIVPFSAMLLIILRRRLLTCQTWAQLVRVVNYESKAIPLSSLQSAAELWLMPSLQLDYGTAKERRKHLPTNNTWYIMFSATWRTSGATLSMYTET